MTQYDYTRTAKAAYTAYADYNTNDTQSYGAWESLSEGSQAVWLNVAKAVVDATQPEEIVSAPAQEQAA